MKKTGKKTFFIVVAFIAVFAVTSVMGIDKLFGDTRTTYVKGVDDIRLGIDIKGGVDVTFGPADDFDADKDQLASATEVIKTRLSSLGITDNEVYSDEKSDRIIVRFPWKVGETNFDPESAVKELGEMAELTFRKGTDTEKDEDGNDVLIDLKKADVGAIYLGNADTEFALKDDEHNTNAIIRKTGIFLKESGGVGTVQHLDLAV